MLNESELRVLGSLIEKQMTTPDYYPLTLNALTAACNQRNNRDPVVEYGDTTLIEALDGLRERGLCRAVHRPGQRTVKYRHAVGDALAVDGEQQALLSVLMLRGPQTLGELRTRTERYHEFASLAEVADVLAGLATRDEPLVERLERRPGEHEPRYRHLLGGSVGPGAETDQPVDDLPETTVSVADDRVGALEDDVAELRSELNVLRSRFDELIRSLGGDGPSAD